MAMKVYLVLSVQLLAVVLGVKWDQNNDPSNWNPSFEYKLDKLPRQAEAKNMPWSDTYWPSYRGGIANRWQDADNDAPGFNYKLNTLEQLKSGKVDINLLSPAEKFDIFHSRYDYPLVNSEWQRVKPDDATWEGICHGWAPAAIIYDQPSNVTMTNQEGLEIPFASSDIKALLSYFLAQFASGQEKTSFIANRCNSDLRRQPKKASSPECWDVNPGTFHVMLTNLIGLSGTGFVCDIDRGIQVWNQPIAKYEYSLHEEGEPDNTSAPGTVKTQPVSFVMYYTKETQPSPTAHEPLILNNQYDYVLDLDARGKIIGGSYDKSQFDRLDFMWASDAPEFFGYFTQLREIYQEATRSSQSRSATRRRRITLADFKAKTIRNNVIRLSSYNDETQEAWLIPNIRNTESLRLLFTSFNTRRHTDFVRIYEVKNGQIQAPIAVLHGNSLPGEISIRPGVSTLITFNVDKMAARSMSSQRGTGFEIIVM